MPLDASHQQQVKDYLNGRYKCGGCGSISPYEMEIVYPHTETAKPGGVVRVLKSMPLLAVTCGNCGLLSFFSAKTVGLTS